MGNKKLPGRRRVPRRKKLSIRREMYFSPADIEAVNLKLDYEKMSFSAWARDVLVRAAKGKPVPKNKTMKDMRYELGHRELGCRDGS